MAKPSSLIRLVIIDDDPHSLEFLFEALSGIGIDIFLSADPLDGLELVRVHRAQIVLTDLMMPKLSGLDVLRRVKAIDPQIKVLIMTCDPTSATRAEAERLGAADCLAKPISLNLIRHVIAHLVGVRSLELTFTPL